MLQGIGKFLGATMNASAVQPSLRESEATLRRRQFLRRVTNKFRPPAPVFKLLHRRSERFECPICAYCGPFATMSSFGGERKHAICPRCGSYERHRLQYLVLRDATGILHARGGRMLHVAPEKWLRKIFAEKFSRYETADLEMGGVDHRVDLRNLPFPEASYDFVFASHVLEHIREDTAAVKEIRRVLRPGGIAILPVPIVAERTVEYPAANPFEAGHVRAPGPDYFRRYEDFFGKVEVFNSAAFPQRFQVYVYEDRSTWPSAECPLRTPMSGERHADFVPVCYA